MAMKYADIQPDEAVADPTNVDVYQVGRDEWHPIEHLREIGQSWHIRYAKGGSHTFPKSHGIRLRRHVEMEMPAENRPDILMAEARAEGEF